VLLRALAPAVPHLVTGANSQFTNPTIGGVDPRTGSPYIFYDVLVGGLGGHQNGDGSEAMGPVFSLELLPVEINEASYPIRIEQMTLITDSAGPGRHRGGCGIRKDVRVLSDTGRFNNLSDRHRFRPWGIFGGGPGALGATILNAGTTEEQPLHSKGTYSLKKDDVISFRLAGAGGYGDPFLRDPARVHRDVVDDLVSVEAARRDYGVAVNPATLEIDREETERIRAAATKRSGEPRQPSHE
jgi:N-methylhydantoinase B